MAILRPQHPVVVVRTGSNGQVRVPNPDDVALTFANIRLERAPDSAGVPGAWAEIQNVAIDQTDPQGMTAITDTGGTTTSWYRYRYAVTGGATFSDYAPQIQAGDSLVRQRLKVEITSTDVTNTMWDTWLGEALEFLQLKAVMVRQLPWDFTPSSDTTERTTLPGNIDLVERVELYDGDDYGMALVQWEQLGRQIRVWGPDTAATYRVYGWKDPKNIGDFLDEGFALLKQAVKWYYAQFRVSSRLDFKYRVVADKNDDVGMRDLLVLASSVKATLDEMIADARPTITRPWRA